MKRPKCRAESESRYQSGVQYSRLCLKVVPILSLVLAIGCATQQLSYSSAPQGVRHSVSDEDMKELAEDNERHPDTQYYAASEWPLHKRAGERPGLGISLSGGGLRSANFSLGVLSALNKLGEPSVFPEQTDLLSTVSGGSYTLTWLYGQHALHGTSFEELLSPEGPKQDALADNTCIVKLSKPGAMATILGNFGIGLPVNLVANGVFGMKANTSFFRSYYEHRLRRAFLGDSSATVPWSAVGEKIQKGATAARLPIPIINATLDLGLGTSDPEEGALAPVFEFTPIRFGSTGLGFYCQEKSALACSSYPKRASLASLERASAVSGAALDTSFFESVGAGTTERTIASIGNFDLGLWFKNPSEERRRSCWLKFFPGAHLLRGAWYRDKGRKGCRILLTDGGHSENLGAFSVVRRFPRVVLVVDAEQDPEYNFPGYGELDRLLSKDLNLTISIPAIDHKKAEWKGPVFDGKIRTLPEVPPAQGGEIGVIYLKIPTRSWVERRCVSSKLGKSICDYWHQHKSFPFDKTFEDQCHDRQQFLAYRDLGLAVVLAHKQEIVDALRKSGIE